MWGETLYLSRIFYINCVSKVKQSPERTNITRRFGRWKVRKSSSKSDLYTTELEKKTVYSPRVSYIFQYFRWRSGPATADQSRRRTAPRWYLLLSFSLSLSLTPLFSIPRGAARSADSIQTNNAVRPLPNVHQPPSPHQTTTSSSSYSSPHKHTRQTTAIRCQRRFIHSILSHSFLTSLLCYHTPRVGIFC